MNDKQNPFEEYVDSNEELFVGPFWELVKFLEEFNPKLLEIILPIIEEEERTASLRAGEHLSVEADKSLDEMCELIANDQKKIKLLKFKKFLSEASPTIIAVGSLLSFGIIKKIVNN